MIPSGIPQNHSTTPPSPISIPTVRLRARPRYAFLDLVSLTPCLSRCPDAELLSWWPYLAGSRRSRPLPSCRSGSRRPFLLHTVSASLAIRRQRAGPFHGCTPATPRRCLTACLCYPPRNRHSTHTRAHAHRPCVGSATHTTQLDPNNALASKPGQVATYHSTPSCARAALDLPSL